MKKDNRKIDLRWSVPVRPIFRVLGGVLGGLFLFFGIMGIYDNLTRSPIIFDNSFKLAISTTILGSLFLFVGSFGRLPKWFDYGSKEE